MSKVTDIKTEKEEQSCVIQQNGADAKYVEKKPSWNVLIFYYPIHCECCGNKENRHFEMIRHCKKCPAPMPKEIHPLCKAMDGKTYHASVSNMLPIDIHGEFIINERIIKEE